jgi:hypothetical protein
VRLFCPAQRWLQRHGSRLLQVQCSTSFNRRVGCWLLHASAPTVMCTHCNSVFGACEPRSMHAAVQRMHSRYQFESTELGQHHQVRRLAAHNDLLAGLGRDDLMGYFLTILEAHAPLLQVQYCQVHMNISNPGEWRQQPCQCILRQRDLCAAGSTSFW